MSSSCSTTPRALRLSGWLALPTFSRSQSDLQFAFLNGRFVRDKLLAGAVRLAYQDVLFHGRFSAYLLYSGIGSDRWSTSTRIRRSSRCGFAIRAAFMISCSAPWSGCSPTRARAPNPRAARRWIGSPAARASAASAPPSQARFVLPEGQPPRPGADAYRSLVARAESARRRGAGRRRPAPDGGRWRLVRRRRAARAMPSRSCTASISWRKPPMAWCWWTCTPRTSA